MSGGELPCTFSLADGETMPHKFNVGCFRDIFLDSRYVSRYEVSESVRDNQKRVHPVVKCVTCPEDEERSHEARAVYPEVRRIHRT